MGLFGRFFGKSPDDVAQDPTYRKLRQQVLDLDPASLGLSRTSKRPAWGFLMETRYPEAVATLVVIADGTTSLYFSNGGGMIGLGEHDEVRAEASELLDGVGPFLPQCAPATKLPLPQKGHTRISLLTFDGLFTAEAPEDDLGNNRHPLSPVFLKGHEVIARAREIEEKRGKR